MRRLLLLLVLLFPRVASANPCVATDAYSTAMCALNPLHYYRLNEDPNAVSAFALDNGNSGTTRNGTYTSCGGGTNCAIAPSIVGPQCDRAYNSINGAAFIPLGVPGSDTEYKIPTANGAALSIDAWYESGSQGGAILGGWQWQYIIYGGRTAGTTAYFQLTRCNSVQYLGSGDIVTGVAGAPVHLTMTTVSDGAGGVSSVKGYIGGTLVWSASSPGSGTFCDTTTFGGVNLVEDGGGSNSFAGKLDEVAFFNYELSQANINSLTAAASTCATATDNWPYTVKQEHPRKLEPPLYLVPGWLTFAQEMHRGL